MNVFAIDRLDSHRAWLEKSYDGERLVVAAYVEAAHAVKLNYKLVSSKSGKSGNSNTKQAGSVTVADGETHRLMQLRLGVNKQDRYDLKLQVFEQGQLVAEDSLSYPD
ncbi:MAG: curli-like amyloid fiber formation chaperone CsgH [Pseudomonadota bacterium]